MSSQAVDTASDMAERIDAGTLTPSRELIDSLRELNAAVARHAARTSKYLKLITKQKEHQ